MNSKELAQAANELLKRDGFWKTEKKKKDSRPVVNGRKRRPSRKQTHTK